jgi:hypothetical protein
LAVDEGSILPPPQVVEIAQHGQQGYAGEESIESSFRKDKMMSDRRLGRAAMGRMLKQVLAAKASA